MLLNTSICDFGWKAPSFSLPDLDKNIVSFENKMGENGLLVAFICNHCPYVQKVIERLVKDANTLQKEGINVVAIMSNNYRSYPEDSPEMMKQFAKTHNFSFPYLLDENQSVAKAYKALLYT